MTFEVIVIFAALVGVSALICSILLPLSFKNHFSTQLTQNKLVSENIKSELDALKSDFSRYNSEEGYDNILKKFKILESDFHSGQGKIDALDTSIKNFYSKWARRLGKIAKEETEEEERPEGLIDPENMYPFGNQPAAPTVEQKHNGFSKFKRVKRAG